MKAWAPQLHRLHLQKEKKEKLVVMAVHIQKSQVRWVHGTLGSVSDNEDKGRTCAPECAYSFPEGRVVATCGGAPRPTQNHPYKGPCPCGKTGTSTPGHADWAEAHNVAFAVNEVRYPII